MISVVLVDYKRENPLLRDCLEALQNQSYSNFEIILLTDYGNDLKYPKLRKKSYGRYVGPAKKRDDGARMAKGEIIAFIDDDAYPREDWLKRINSDFKNKDIVGVGGPGITPPNSPWQEKASGWVSASPLGGGPFGYRFLPEKTRFVDDYPSMNLAIRREDILTVGGFDSDFWPGEDTKLCHDLVYKLGKKIVYDPEVIVYHHRRPLWTAHLRQNGNFGLHRGYFARVLPKTSRRLSYFAPSLLLLFFPLTIFPYGIFLLANAVWVAYKSGSLGQGIISMPAVFLTHLWYGIRFLQGFLLTTKLAR